MKRILLISFLVLFLGNSCQEESVKLAESSSNVVLQEERTDMKSPDEVVGVFLEGVGEDEIFKRLYNNG